MHLWWEIDAGDEPLAEVAATLEVLRPPQVTRLYFWAVQASFEDDGSHVGAGHLGLQWGAEAVPRRYVNWGGYASGGAVLDGTVSPLPSSLDDPNTRDFQWDEARPYRLRIHRSPERAGAWRGDVTDMVTGIVTVVRDLFSPGARLAHPVVWSEVFADCDAPQVAVRWSGLEALTLSGRSLPAVAVRTTYQSRQEGGCDNTTALPDGTGVIQLTNADRRIRPGARLALG